MNNPWATRIAEALPLNNTPLITIEWVEQLVNRYNDPTRFYHTPAHIIDLLTKLTSLNSTPKPELVYAILLHDVVYDVKTVDRENVIASAKLALECIGGDIDLDANEVHRLILATSHESTDAFGDDRDILRDLDMSILSDSPLRYRLYAEQIMQEYTTVYSLHQYIEGRKKFLTKMLNRAEDGKLFFSLLARRYTLNAIRNMYWEAEQL